MPVYDFASVLEVLGTIAIFGLYAGLELGALLLFIDPK